MLLSRWAAVLTDVRFVFGLYLPIRRYTLLQFYSTFCWINSVISPMLLKRSWYCVTTSWMLGFRSMHRGGGGGRNGPKVNVSSIIPYKLLALSTLTAFYILPENILQVRVAVPHCMHKCSIVLSKSVGVHTTILLCICFSCESWTCVGCEKHISSWDNKHYPYVPSIILYFSTDGDGIFFSFISSCIPDFWDESAINYTCNKKGSYTYSIHANHW